MAESSNNRNNNIKNDNISTDNKPQQEDLYPAALKAIEDDNLERIQLIFNLEHFKKTSLDNLLQKACERSKDIDVEEDFVRNNTNRSDSGDELSMISICRTSRKNNEKLVQTLLKARCQAEEVKGNETKQTPVQTSKSLFTTPTKPELKSLEKKRVSKTPELPHFKSKVNRQLEF